MQLKLAAVALAAMASVTSAGETVTVYACSSSTSSAAGVASPTIASTGVVTAQTATGSPITHATDAAPMNGVSAFGMIVAGGVALFM